MLRSMKKVLVAVAALAAIGLGSAALAGAATSATGSTGASGAAGATSPPTQVAPGAPGANMPAPGTAAHEDAEKAVTGDAAAKAQAAAVKSVGSGTAGAVTTDCTGTGYETTVTKADGTTVEVHLDSNFNVVSGHGGPGGLPGGPPPSGQAG